MKIRRRWLLIAAAGCVTLYGAWLYYQPGRKLPPLRKARDVQYFTFNLVDLAKLDANFLVVGCGSDTIEKMKNFKNCLACLTHAKGNQIETKADLSTEMCFNFIESSECVFDGVTTDQIDVNSICSCYVFIHPTTALANKNLLIEIARAGAFAKTTNIQAARIR